MPVLGFGYGRALPLRAQDEQRKKKLEGWVEEAT